MKNFWKNALLAILLLQNMPTFGYAISHNEDSELKEVTIFVFTSEEDFEKMLKSYGTSEQALGQIAKAVPAITTASSYAATAAGNPELIPIFVAIGAGLTAASKYAVGPARWVMQQKYNVAIHKHTYRGNKGKDAEWNWADIKKDTGIEPSDSRGLFVVFLNPANKDVLLMAHMASNAAFGFTAVTDPETGKLVGLKVPFERDLKELAEKDPSTLARLFAYAKNRYDNPHKIIWDLKDAFNTTKKALADFSKKYPSSKDKLRFLSAQLDEAQMNIKQYDSVSAKQDAQDLVAFFKREIEAGKRLAQDEEAKELFNRAARKFNLFKNALNDIVLKPAAGYQADTTKKPDEKKESIIPDIPLLKGPTKVAEDNYSILGLEQGASTEDIRTAYKNLVRQWHPDRNPDNQEEAAEKFRKIKQAYDGLTA